MDRLALLLCASAIISVVFGSENHEKAIEDYVAKSKDISPAIWFELPHMGLSKRNLNFHEWDCDQLDEYIRTIPWPMVERCFITEDKRDKSKSSQFIPRLGRDFADMFGRNLLSGHEFINTRSQFSPRLGRRLTYTPRLGRESLTAW